jgi:dTMP kinase
MDADPANSSVLDSPPRMTPRGKFIVLEGIDGSGKRTQLDLLTAALSARHLPHERISFPRYDGFFGNLVARFLNGEFGTNDDVDAHLSALLYAGDRLEARPRMEQILAAGKMLVADRYVASNLAHQGARVPSEQREEFLKWLTKLEYEIYGLPKEDAVIYLRVPATEAYRQIAAKDPRGYTNLKRDILESDVAHLTTAALVYDSLAHAANWFTIECFDEAREALRPADEIHGLVLAALNFERKSSDK